MLLVKICMWLLPRAFFLTYFLVYLFQIYDGVMKKVGEGPPLAKSIFHYAMKVIATPNVHFLTLLANCYWLFRLLALRCL